MFVWSSARAQAAATARAKKLARARDDLDAPGARAGSRHYPDAEAVTARVAAIAKHPHGSPPTCAPRSAPTRPPANPPWPGTSTRHALDAEAATDGWYALLTNLTPPRPTPPRSCAATRARRSSNAATAHFKGPLAVAPMFLQDNRRIAALITVICLALLVFCLIERQVRQAIAPADKLTASTPAPPAKPTGRLIFDALARLRLIPASGTDPPIIPRPPPLQARLLDLLDVDPTRPR